MILESQLNREKETKVELSTKFEKSGGDPPVNSAEVVTSTSVNSPQVQPGLREEKSNP